MPLIDSPSWIISLIATHTTVVLFAHISLIDLGIVVGLILACVAIPVKACIYFYLSCWNARSPTIPQVISPVFWFSLRALVRIVIKWISNLHATKAGTTMGAIQIVVHNSPWYDVILPRWLFSHRGMALLRIRLIQIAESNQRFFPLNLVPFSLWSFLASCSIQNA